MATITEAIIKLRPNTEWVLHNNDLLTLEFIKPKNTVKPTQAEIDAAIQELDAAAQAEAEANATAKAALLARLGITADEAKLLLQ